MAEKKKGFHALEQRIHDMEEQDKAGERTASGGEQKQGSAKSAQPPQQQEKKRS